MNGPAWMASLGGAAHRVKADVRRRMAAAAIVLCGAVLLACALGFAVAAGYLWLALRLPDYLAALCVAGALLLLGGCVIAVTVARSRTRRGSAASGQCRALAAEAEDAADRAVREAMVQVRANPSAAMLSALTLGVVVGLLRPMDRP
jgi:small-conductance mechanosensitive channel